MVNCTSYFDQDGNKVPMDASHGEMILNDIYRNQMAVNGLRGIAFAFRDIAVDEWEGIQQQLNPNDE